MEEEQNTLVENLPDNDQHEHVLQQENISDPSTIYRTTMANMEVHHSHRLKEK